MDVAALAALLHETAEHHGDIEAVTPPHDWWDWYAAYMGAQAGGKRLRRRLGGRQALHDGGQACRGARVSGNTVAAVAGSRAEAYLIAGLLEANGIAAIVSTDDAGGQEPQWQLTEGVRVLVATDDLARAQALISKTPGGQTRASDRHHGHDQEQPLQDLDGPRTHPSAQGRGLDIHGGGWAAGAPEYDDTSSARFWRTTRLGGTLTAGPVPGASSPDPTPEHFLAKGSR